MGKESGDGETGVDKEKWWEEERRVYRGRVDSFISRMHSIQGDRRFSRWKGSVLDSIIGVFLTQNVSDHLSSSAYMSLAARFPAKTIGGNHSQNAEKVSSPVALEDAIGEHGRLSEQSSGAPSSAQVHESEQVDLKEMANCKQTIESNTESGVFDYSKGNGLECHQRELQIGHVSREIGSATAVNSTSCMNGVGGLDGRPLEDVASSPNSAVSSQNSSEYIVQEADQSKGNSILSNGDDLLTSGIGNTGTNSFMELLKLASNGGLQEIDTHHKGRAPMENNGGIDRLTDPSIDQRPSFPDHFGHLGIRQCGISAEHLNARTTATTATFQQGGTEVTLQVETTQREVKAQLENCIEFNNQKNTFEVTALVDSHLRNQPNVSQKIPAGVKH
ncbi:protein ROS1-like isoform X1 [Iris pallida]|uniref:Protein ROS1-like isoform X1 n=1 Tax=Iris pallida TaxID=29817 RepID=A0AAX6F9J6_IRIPA|nr:protein ROS1-like isoform X1 [Iris pallida]